MDTLKIIEGQIETVSEKICNLSSYGMGLHPNDIKPDIKQSIKQILEAEVEYWKDVFDKRPANRDLESDNIAQNFARIEIDRLTNIINKL
jgi:hypothetical protein